MTTTEIRPAAPGGGPGPARSSDVGPPDPPLLARVLGFVGRLLIWVGAIILLFVAYQLWGTGIAEARAQSALEDEFAELLAEFDVDPATTTTAPEATTTTTTTAPVVTAPTTTAPPPPPDDGEAVARIVIPRIGVDKIVVEGVGRSDLQKGPGHYPGTPMPGQPGNAAIAGHRTTYGAPFFDVGDLVPGDEIIVTTLQGVFRYEVSGTEIVTPDRVDVITDQGDDRLTLTTCHPKYSARQRMIVSALLVDDPAPAPEPPAEPVDPVDELADDGVDSADDGAGEGTSDVTGGDGQDLTAAGFTSLDGEVERSALPAVLLGVLTLIVWLGLWQLSRRWKRVPAYLIGAPIFGVTLFVWFGAISDALPANF